jgi:hypothetical protein
MNQINNQSSESVRNDKQILKQFLNDYKNLMVSID